MERSSSREPASRKIRSVIGKTIARCFQHSNLPLVPIQSQMNLIQDVTSYLTNKMCVKFQSNTNFIIKKPKHVANKLFTYILIYILYNKRCVRLKSYIQFIGY